MTIVKIPDKFEGLWKPKRYKVFYGGRGGAKSHNVARFLLVEGMQAKKRILCTRELQSSIQDSVHKLLSDIISDHDALSKFYTVQRDKILGLNGTEFIFKGLKHNATEIKSTEGIDYAWVEEAEKVSNNSWEVLIPTIRKEGSEIIITFNPKHPTDPTYERFVTYADNDMLVVKVGWQDNPFFPKVLDDERKRLQKNDPLAYKHVWEGEFDQRHFGGIYANYLDEARKVNRIGQVPHKPGIPVVTGWDLGKADSTAIWFGQMVGLQPRIIDYYENSGQQLSHYAELIRSKPYEYAYHALPHDAGHDRLGNPDTIAGQLRGYGLNCRILPRTRIQDRIEAGRALINEAYIDNDKCKDGLHALMNYQYEWDGDKNKFKPNPLHDWASDPADAFGYLAQALRKQEIKKPAPQARRTPQRRSWMG